MITARSIKSHHAGVFTYLQGDLDRLASRCRTPEEADASSLVFVTDASQLASALARKPAIVVIPSAAPPLFSGSLGADECCFSVDNISTGMATLFKYFDEKRQRFTEWGDRHSTAVVHATARLGSRVFLSPYCVIGANAEIGDDSLIGAHSVIECGAKIGQRAIIHPHVFIGARCEIGDDCEIHPHTTVGSDGFGYSMSAGHKMQKIPQLGNVIIGDRVEIGSNCAVDRATLASTHIRSGTKLDNICHIAHNCDLGEDGCYTAGFMMGGSTKIGKRFVTGGNSVVTTHVTIADDVALAGRSTVTNDVVDAGNYGGYPLQPLVHAMKTLASISRLNGMRQNVNRLVKAVSDRKNPS